jgi:hypothetical protein
MPDIPEYKPPAADKPPKGGERKARTPKGKKPPRPKPKPTMPVDEIRSELKEFCIGIGMLAMMKNEVDGLIIVGGTPDVVDAWCDLAEKNPYVHIVLQKFCEGGDAAKVLSTTIPLALALAHNHGAYKGPLPVSPDAYAKKAAEVVEDALADDDSETDEDGIVTSTAVVVP